MNVNDQILQMLGKILDIKDDLQAVALMDQDGTVLAQTENWDLRADSRGFVNAWKNGGGSTTILGIKYHIVENTPERLIGTNVTGGKGHVIGVSAGNAKIAVFLNPTIGPTEVLNDIYLEAQRIGNFL